MTGQGIATVARQEFRLRIRAGRWRLLLAIWFGILLAFTALLSAAVDGFGNDNDVLDKGIVIYGGLMLFVLGLALLVVPALAAQSVNGDRERGTLATLQVTRLTAADIALGKFAAAWGTSLVFLALTLPLVGYAITQGGVTVGRTVVVTLVIALLLGTVCAVSLALSALLSRTTTSGVLAYLAVFALTLGTLITFALVTAMTTETVEQTYENACPTDLPPDLSEEDRARILGTCGQVETFTATRTRTDRTWWLLAPNPFVVLADAAPQLPPLTEEEQRRRDRARDSGRYQQDARDLDPLGSIGKEVRGLRDGPDDNTGGTAVASYQLPGSAPVDGIPVRHKRVWPYGLAFDVLLAGAALLITTRRLHTPTRDLPKGQRVA